MIITQLAVVLMSQSRDTYGSVDIAALYSANNMGSSYFLINFQYIGGNNH